MSDHQTHAFFHLVARSAALRPLFPGIRDYRTLLDLLARALDSCPVDLLAFAVLPDHWELIVGPSDTLRSRELVDRVCATHSTRLMRRSRIRARANGYARPLVRPIHSPVPLVRACRDIERRAVQFGLVGRAQDWPWSSLSERYRLRGHVPLVRAGFLGSNWWADYVNRAPSEATPASRRLLDDLTEAPRRLSAGAERPEHRVDGIRPDDQDHPDSHVERPEHLGVGHSTGLLQPGEQRRHRPAVAIDRERQPVGQRPRNVLRQAAPGDVGHALDLL